MSRATVAQGVDFLCKNEGSIWLIRPTSHEAEQWLRSVTSEEATWFGGGLVVEHRYVEDLLDLLEGAREAGYRLGPDA